MSFMIIANSVSSYKSILLLSTKFLLASLFYVSFYYSYHNASTLVVFYYLTIFSFALLFFRTHEINNQLKIYSFLSLFYFMAIVFITFKYDYHDLFTWRFEYYYFLALTFPIAYAISFLSDSSKFWWYFLLSVSSLVFFKLILVLVTNDPMIRGQGLFSNEFTIGNMSLLFGLVALIASFAVQNKYFKIYGIALFFIALYISFMSGTRSGWVSLPLVFATILFFLYKYGYKNEFRALLVTLIISLVSLLFFIDNFPIVSRIDAAINDIQKYLEGDARSSVGYRFAMWEASVKAIVERPFLGWGFRS